MYVFHYKLTSSRASKQYEFQGTWMEFEDKYPSAILTTVPEPIETPDWDMMDDL